jgi:hypothetical protein
VTVVKPSPVLKAELEALTRDRPGVRIRYISPGEALVVNDPDW